MANRLQKGSAAAAMAVALVGSFEGLRQHAYPDPATQGQPWTICYGSTNGVKPGDHKTVGECRALLSLELQRYANGIEQCVTVPLPDARFVALTSFAYNVGIRAACGSSAVKLINQGRPAEGCEALLKWNRAAGITFPGLTRRRQKERAFCLEGI
ncbi:MULTISPECIES: lysozyme [Rhizobium]|uniref:lysozyme n=1 Tax=Rhizobium TaxID=379 RepID=UPI001B32F7E5|nr:MULTISPECIES: lysozyme [Rhizobium]MBX4908345.1 lysozyme [Rhizobium bangladeshense]MBX5233561.1 lysozyme [Rhizobium sp. NLR4a]MBX5239661.1 lysozyme [Rhizobium sp. NLR22b]MBX5251200.1 lysozyme [Rhizobium sp. NLR4b]MBX5257478.1 lysozyme [Rhizobium sp. NLR16b]